jgi:preprotein translocase subunit SecD
METDMKSKRRNWLRITTLVFILLIAIGVDWPGGVHFDIPKAKFTTQKSFPFVNVKRDGNLYSFNNNLDIKQGLDLQGGSHLVYTVDMSKVPSNDRSNALASLQKVIENRVNAFGVSEPTVYTSKNGSDYRVTIELAGIKDTESAMNIIGTTAKLIFKESNADGTNFVDTNLGGSDLKSSTVEFDQTTGAPQIGIQFNSEGAKKFEEITGRNVGKPLAIYLDETAVSTPTVNAQISGGSAQITGKFTLQEAKNLSIQLNAGRLPVPITLAEQRTVEATLGQESIRLSLVAGILGVLVVSLFMIFYYRVLGIFSTLGLGLYLIFSLALFKIFGITLTMGGIAGLILSVGMSMETDVLVFERIREEMRNGRNFDHSYTLGFNRAWTSIRDANLVSLIICALLLYVGGSVRGFAIVLALGIVVGLVTTFLGTRALIELIARKKFVNNNWLFNVEPDSATETEGKNQRRTK